MRLWIQSALNIKKWIKSVLKLRKSIYFFIWFAFLFFAEKGLRFFFLLFFVFVFYFLFSVFLLLFFLFFFSSLELPRRRLKSCRGGIVVFSGGCSWIFSISTPCARKFIGEILPNWCFLCRSTFWSTPKKCWNFWRAYIARKFCGIVVFLGGCSWIFSISIPCARKFIGGILPR